MLSTLSLVSFVLCFAAQVAPPGPQVMAGDVAASLSDTAAAAASPSHRAAAALARSPVAFVENRGQLDPAVRLAARCGSTTAFFTDHGFRLSLRGESRESLTGDESFDEVLAEDGAAGDADGHADGRHAEDVAGAHVFLTFEESLADVVLRGAGQRLAPVRTYRGDDPSAWVTEAPSWTELRYEGLYAGVDLAVLERDGSLAYDLLIAPGVDPSRIVVGCEGVTGLSLDEQRLVLETAAGPLVQTPPLAWQVGSSGERLPVQVGFRLLGAHRYGFTVDGLSESLPLVIDPGLTWGTALGGTFADRITSVALAPDGDLVVTGTTGSPDFPTSPGAFQTSVVGFSDAFVARLDPVGGQLRFSTFLGGTDTVIFRPEVGEDVAIASDGSIVVAGEATSPDFPTTQGVFQPASSGGTDAFVASFDGSGVLQWSTRLGGSKNDSAATLALAPDGTITVAGNTFSSDLPTTPGAFDESFNSLFLSNDIFVCRLSADGVSLDWCTYVGGVLRDEARDLLLHPDGRVTVGGLSGSVDFPATAGAYDESYNGSSGTETDGVLLQLSPTGASLDFATYLGSTEITEICALAQAIDGDFVVAGTTFGADFPTTPGARQKAFGGGQTDGFVSRLSANGATLQWSTFFGGQGDDAMHSLALDGGDQPTFVGSTASPGLFFDAAPDLPDGSGGTGASPSAPLSSGPAGPVLGGGFSPGGSPGHGSDLFLDGPLDAFLGRLSPDGKSLVWGTFHGGAAEEEGTALILDAFGDAWVAGFGDSADLPTTAAAVDPSPNGSFDGFVAHFAVPPVFQLNLGSGSDGQTPGAGVAPLTLTLDGSFWPGTPWSLDLGGCPPGGRVLLLLGSGGASPSGGALPGFVGSVHAVLPLVADEDGRCALGGSSWPAPGTRLVLQAWLPGEQPRASNGVLLLSP